MAEWMNARTNEWKKQTKEWINIRMTEQVNDRTNEWMNETASKMTDRIGSFVFLLFLKLKSLLSEKQRHEQKWFKWNPESKQRKTDIVCGVYKEIREKQNNPFLVSSACTYKHPVRWCQVIRLGSRSTPADNGAVRKGYVLHGSRPGKRWVRNSACRKHLASSEVPAIFSWLPRCHWSGD